MAYTSEYAHNSLLNDSSLIKKAYVGSKKGASKKKRKKKKRNRCSSSLINTSKFG